jgi:hypothetical protein
LVRAAALNLLEQPVDALVSLGRHGFGFTYSRDQVPDVGADRAVARASRRDDYQDIQAEL